MNYKYLSSSKAFNAPINFCSNPFLNLDTCWSQGDGIGGTDKKLLGTIETREECKTRVMESEPSANGATYGPYGPQCYAEFSMSSANADIYYQTCHSKTKSNHLTTLKLYTIILFESFYYKLLENAYYIETI